MPQSTFDLVVLGTGPAAATAAPLVRNEGWSVAVVDARPFGGTCPNRGCIPKKVLWSAADAMDALRRAQVLGVSAPSASLDWRALHAFKRTFTDPVPESSEKAFRDAGIETFHGVARFTGAREIRVGTDGTSLTAARHVLIATGAAPLRLGITGEEHVATSDDFLDLPELPRRIAFIGGGYISMEFAHIALRAGAEVTVLHRSDRPLPGFDPQLVDALVNESRAHGMRIELNTRVLGVEPRGGAFRVLCDGAAYEADLVVHGAGRAPNIGALELVAGGVDSTPKGVAVNTYMQSVSNPAVYAAGDVAASGPALTPVSSQNAKVAALNILRGNHAEVSYDVVPSVAFTIPPIASVGLSEAAAQKKGHTFRVNTGDSSSWTTSRRIGETASAYKVLIEEKTERILGAHLLGAHSEEVINVFALAMKHDLRARDLASLPWAYPTKAYDVTYML